MVPDEKRNKLIVFEVGRWYLVIDTAIGLNISRDAVMRLIRKGELTAMAYPRMGGRGRNTKWMVEGGSVLRFIERCKQRAVA